MAQTTNVGHMSAWSLARSRGYTGTREEYAELMASYATVAQQAAESAGNASQSATNASQSAQNAETAKGTAQQAATDAQTAQASAQESAQSAQQSAQSASQSAQTAESAKQTAVNAVDGFAAGAQQALDSVNQAGINWKSLAEAQKLDSEAWAVGTRDGEDVGSSDPAYHNNAKYYAEQGGAEVTAAQQARQGAESAQGKAEAAQTAAETAQTKAEEAAERADVKSDGTYDNMTAGSAKQIISSKYTVETEPYLFRASGGDGADREYDEIVGGSIVWNQMFDYSNVLKNYKNDVMAVDDDIVSFTASQQYGGIHMMFPVVAEHKYLYWFYLKSDAAGNILRTNYTVPGVNLGVQFTVNNANSWEFKSVLKSAGISANIGLFFQETRLSDWTEIQLKDVAIFDLTQMFGSEIADYIYNLEQTTPGAGVAWFRKYFSKDYYRYNAGELMHVGDLQSHDTVGFNAWDEEWEVGYYDENGNPVASTAQIRSKNFIQVIPGVEYYAKMSSHPHRFCYYTADKTFIGRSDLYDSKNHLFVVSDNCAYIKFHADIAGGTYQNDICINLSWNGERDGEYEPYVKRSYPLDSSLTLRGIPKLSTDGKLYYDGDHYKSDGTVERRYGTVDLGTLNYTIHPNYANVFYTTIPNKKIGATSFLSHKYVTTTISLPNMTNGQVIANNANAIVYFKNTDYTDATAFKEAMSGVYLVYELTTPTTETADPYQSLQITDPYGTEEYVTTGIVPVGHETKYPENLRAKIEGLPWDFSSLIAPTENGIASRNYTVGSLLIMGNVLYKVTANIANGGAITPNTNVTATTLSEVISALA